MPKVPKAGKVATTEQLDQRESEKRGEPAKLMLSFLLKEDLAKLVQIEALLPMEERNWLLDFLWNNSNFFF